jgi:hypothetical protein
MISIDYERVFDVTINNHQSGQRMEVLIKTYSNFIVATISRDLQIAKLCQDTVLNYY